MTDRYWPGDTDHSPKAYSYMNRVLKIYDDAVFKLESELLKAKKVKAF